MSLAENRRFRPLFVVCVAALFLTVVGSAHGAAPTDAEPFLNEARQALDAGRWDDAARALMVAEQASDNAEFQRRVAVFRRELFTVVRLDEIRYDFPTNAYRFDCEAESDAYRQTFRGYGLDPEQADEEMKQRGRSSPIRPQLIAALDEWARIFPLEDTRRMLLLDFADSLDDSEERHRVRAAVREKDLSRLQLLALVVDVKTLTPATLLLLEKTLDRLGESDKREDLLRRGQQAFPPDFWILIHLGDLLLEEERVEEAIPYLRAALAMQPDNVLALMHLAEALRAANCLVEAETAAREAVRARPKWIDTHLILVRVLHKQGKDAQADTACREASRLNGGNAAAQCLYGHLLGMRAKRSDAEAIFRRVLVFEPDNAEAIGGLGVALYEENNFREAEPLLREAIRRGTEWTEVRVTLGMLLMKQNRDAEAETHLREFLRHNPGNTTARASLGMTVLRQGRAVEADLACREALRRDPTDMDAQYVLGRALLQENMPEQAEAAFREILRRNESDEEAWSSLGVALFAQQKVGDAEAIFRTALKHLPNSAQLHNDLGGVLLLQNRNDEAEALFREALRLKPTHGQARHNLVEVLERGQRYEEAKALLRQAVAANQDDVESWMSLAEIGSMTSSYEEVETAARAVAQLRPDSTEARCNLAVALEFQGRFEAALAELRQLKPDVLAASSPVCFSCNLLEREVIWERQWPAILSGAVTPANAADAAAMARMCLIKDHPGAAVRLYEESVRKDPQVLADVEMCHRHLAAAAAVMAAYTQGEDAPADETERERLRRQGLAWLREEISAWSKMAIEEDGRDRVFVHRLVERVQQVKWFESVRGAKSLALLPPKEREDWAQLWRDVEALRQRTFKNRN